LKSCATLPEALHATRLLELLLVLLLLGHILRHDITRSVPDITRRDLDFDHSAVLEAVESRGRFEVGHRLEARQHRRHLLWWIDLLDGHGQEFVA
jgi:hypothetical protein